MYYIILFYYMYINFSKKFKIYLKKDFLFKIIIFYNSILK